MFSEFLLLIAIILIFAIILKAVRKDRFRGSRTFGNALQEMHSAVDPGVRNVIEEKQADTGRPVW